MKTDTVIRTIVLIIALANQILTAAGKSPLPIEDESVKELITVGFTVASAMAAWWKNNSFTEEAVRADEFMEELKSLKKE